MIGMENTMSQFKWDASYSVSVKQFDTDHQQLIDILNELYDGMTAGQGQQVLQGVLNRLVAYAQRHFAAEEVAMRKIQYANFQAHLDEHRKFTAKVGTVMQELKTEKSASRWSFLISSPAGSSITSWWSTNITVRR